MQVAMSAYGEEALNCYARMHLRGASTLLSEKPGYKVEFTRKASGKKKISCQTPGFGVMDGFILLAMASDETRMRDRLRWDLYAQMASDGESFSARRTGYVELFIDNQYMGLYLLVEPIDMEDELAKSGESCILTDSVYRTAALNFSYDRAYVQHPYRDNAGYELYYAPVAGHEFDSLQAYLDLLAEEDDEQFCEKALACVDTDSLLRYVLLIQGGGMTDNVFNNMYIWAHRTSRGVIYRFAPWDMDMTWGLKKEDIGEEFENWLYYPLADRLLNLNPDGLRDRLAQMWRQMRETALNEEHIAQLIAQYYTELRDSGALMRDGMRWDSGIYEPDGDEIINFCSMRFPLLDEAIGRMAASPDEPVDFLEATEYDKKGGPIIRDFVQTGGQRGQSGGNRRA